MEQVKERPDNIQQRKRLKRGWNQDKEAKKVDERTRDRVKKASEARNKIGQVVALQAQAQQRQAASIAFSQMHGMDLVAQATAAKAIAQANENKPGHEAGKNASSRNKGKWAKLLAGAKNIKQLGRRIERLGYDVGEHPAFGGVNPVHVGTSKKYGDTHGFTYPGQQGKSLHYKGLAFDITGDKLMRLWKALKKSGLPIDEAFYKNMFLGEGEGPVPNHENHIHLGMLRKRGYRRG